MKKYLNYLFTGLRILVGWHFLYEGIAKLLTTGWSSKMYLMGSNWIFSDLFHRMADAPGLMRTIDLLNIWGLILIGLSLFTGLLIRWSSIAGALLLLFYFIAYPPIPGHTFGSIAEGSYLFVNKNLIEFTLLLVFAAVPTEYFFGIDRLIKRWKEEKPHAPVPPVKKEGVILQRREILRDLISLPLLGAFAYAVYRKRKWDSYERKFLTGKADAISSATLKTFTFSSLSDLKGQVPKGKLGDIELSRLIMGGNLIGGWSHARDLIYTDKLVKAYHTDEKVMMTMQLAEKCGINAILTNPSLCRIINKYWQETDGKIKFISDGGASEESIIKSVEGGACSVYVHGGSADRFAYDGKIDEIAKYLEMIRSYGVPAGIGAHRIETIKACVERGLKPDYWVKTIHHHNYWSAKVDLERQTTVDDGFKDNMFDFTPQETIDFMNKLEQPWIGYKILAAGAIQPKDGVRYAFDNGADFICVGMYDFQVVEDCNIVLDSLAKVTRVRPWRG
ncbi:MAG: DoxX family protein [Bacteroidales bacterium]|nr:DoxX family protein [Bacteroidales bacterium]